MSTTSTTACTRLSASCQQVVYEDLTNTSDAKVIIRSCMGDPDLSPAITCHKCNSVVLTPSGLYADMAVTVAEYIWKHYRGQHADIPGYNLSALEVHKPLIVKDPSRMDQLWLEMETTLSTYPGSSGDVLDAVLKCVIYSITPNGTRLQENGHSTVRFDWYYGWLSEWQNHTAEVKSSISRLYSRAATNPSGTTQLVHRQKAYQLFESFVQYSGKYQNMSEVVFDSSTLEATSVLNFLPDPAVDWALPYYLDGSCHVSGFVCNAVEPDKDKNAFISNGVGVMKISPHFRPAAPGAEIRNYVRMQQLPNDKTVLSGDVYILQDGEIVGVWEGVRFKKIPRRVLNVFLPPPKKV